MSLFAYSVSIAGGRRKAGKVTAKSEAEARKRVSKEVSVVEWHSLEIVPPPIHPPANAKPEKIALPIKTSAKPKAKAMGKLEKMLFLQNGRCFFCGLNLPIESASVEHLNPRSRGGSSSEDNEVVCHKTLNHAFGDLDLKRKFEYVIRNSGNFRCPP